MSNEGLRNPEDSLNEAKISTANLKELLNNLRGKKLTGEVSNTDLDTYINSTGRYLDSLRDSLDKMEDK